MHSLFSSLSRVSFTRNLMLNFFLYSKQTACKLKVSTILKIAFTQERFLIFD